jgi:hypothetical protein
MNNLGSVQEHGSQGALKEQSKHNDIDNQFGQAHYLNKRG